MKEANPELPMWHEAYEYAYTSNHIFNVRREIDYFLWDRLSRTTDYEDVSLTTETVTIVHRDEPDTLVEVWALYFCEHSDYMFEYLINASCYMDALRWVLERFDIIPKSGRNLVALGVPDGWGQIDDLTYTPGYWDYCLSTTKG